METRACGVIVKLTVLYFSKTTSKHSQTHLRKSSQEAIDPWIYPWIY